MATPSPFPVPTLPVPTPPSAPCPAAGAQPRPEEIEAVVRRLISEGNPGEMSVTKICELVADQLGASVRRSVLRPVVDQILREKADAAAAIESAAGDSDGGASDGGAPEEYALEEEESEEARNDEMDVDGSEAEAALRSRVLYFTDPPDWEDIEQEARQIGCDDAWLQ